MWLELFCRNVQAESSKRIHSKRYMLNSFRMEVSNNFITMFSPLLHDYKSGNRPSYIFIPTPPPPPPRNLSLCTKLPHLRTRRTDMNNILLDCVFPLNVAHLALKHSFRAIPHPIKFQVLNAPWGYTVPKSFLVLNM